MKLYFTLQKSFLLLFSVLFVSQAVAQVGINTTNPLGGSILDVTSTNKGVLIPRVNIANLNTIAPIDGGATESLLVYNTNSSTGKGFFYWTGIKWERLAISSEASDDWKITGNSGTTSLLNFIGTTDNVALNFRTRGLRRFEITTETSQTSGGRLRAFTDGTAAEPIYSWASNPGTGIFKPDFNTLGLSTRGQERLRINDNGNIGINTAIPGGGAILDVNSTNKGILIPKVNIIDLNNIAPVTGGSTEGLLVYNTNTTTGPGFYYWYGNRWTHIGVKGTNNNIPPVIGTDNATCHDGNFSNIPNMVISFIPRTPVVYVSYFLSGKQNGNNKEAECQITVNNNDAVEISRATTLSSTSGDKYQVSHAMIPVSVTVGQPTTLRLQWRLTRNGAIQNHPGSDDIRYMTIID
ncbi:hypothetical protein [Aequorivita sinensis]|uniref:hypothetical protein n=1 Tax=Aequorivita sinensis TaxID=1382458 RepID=UPI00111D9E83|nr:hypothetical protein [Aequorivita sinensis]